MNRVAVLILTWNDFFDTKECIESILISENKNSLDLFIINNGSNRKISAQLESFQTLHSDKITLLDTSSNLGFAGGMNFGIRSLNLEDYSHVLLLNNDTIIPEGALDTLIFESVELQASVAGPCITYYPETEEIWHGGGRISQIGTILTDQYKKDFSSALQKQASVKCDFISGCVMLLSTKLLRKGVFLDDAYFYSVEDLDFCLQMREQGEAIFFIPSSQVHHKVSRSSGGWLSSFSCQHFIWGRGRLSRKQKGLCRIGNLIIDILGYAPNRAWRMDDGDKRTFGLKYLSLLKYYFMGFSGRSVQ